MLGGARSPRRERHERLLRVFHRETFRRCPFRSFFLKPAVEELARRLAKEGVEAWLDKWHLIPGDPWQPALEKALAESETCAVFVGPSGFGPWQNEEMRAAIDRRVSDH